MSIFLLRLIFGAIFVWSGIAKLKDPISFGDAVRNFKIVGDPIAPALALFIPWVELIAGFAVMIWGARRGKAGTITLLGCIVIFTIAIVSAWVRGLDISCGCFGGAGAVNYSIKIATNCGLIAVGIFLLRVSLQSK